MAFLWPSLFVSPVMVPGIDILLDFCLQEKKRNMKNSYGLKGKGDDLSQGPLKRKRDVVQILPKHQDNEV
jgi:hypothetical protein